MARKLTHYDRRRLERRNSLWPESKALIYDKRNETGFCTVPRTLPLICTLIKHLSKRKDPSRIYLDLWSRQRDDGFVEVEDAEELAASSGYASPPRNVRTWREGMDELERLGFIQTAARGTRKHKYVLLFHPHDVAQRIHHESPKAIPEWWWDLFTNRVMDIRGKLRWEPPPARAEQSFEDFPEALDDDDDDLPF